MKRAGAKKSAEESAESGTTVELTGTEEREVKKRTALRPEVVFETVRREGDSELNRTAPALAFSAFAAGLSMGFSMIVPGFLHAALPAAPWRVLVENLGYTAGFIIVVLGRQQLFTENTVTAILPLLDATRKFGIFLKVCRLWSIVLCGNLLGAAVIAVVLAHTSTFDPNVKDAFQTLGLETLAPSFGAILLKGIFAGWLIALMVWLLPAAGPQKLPVVLLITYLVGVLGLSHVIAGSVEGIYVVTAGAVSLQTYLAHFLLPVFIGNVIGGVLLVSLLNYGQVVPDINETPEKPKIPAPPSSEER
ncbi:MAG: formate/nitrite transporter family protein [Candidatus Eremiobacteraeota bacterium]|nr:formate/nitrite transporter family protein [Candidatus Eremiobacteraeota bacterium]